jgi:hypothetical protein
MEKRRDRNLSFNGKPTSQQAAKRIKAEHMDEHHSTGPE